MDRKLVVFVPREALDPVRDALFAAGAGRIGNYDALLLVHARHGHVLRRRGLRTRTWASRGREQRVSELRLETVYPEELHDAVIAALNEAHPYETPAYDIYPLL